MALLFSRAAPAAGSDLALGWTITAELARRTCTSKGSASPVGSSKSAALNSTRYSVGRFVSNGLNARTIARPVFRQNPNPSRIFSTDPTVTRIVLSAGAATCSPA